MVRGRAIPKILWAGPLAPKMPILLFTLLLYSFKLVSDYYHNIFKNIWAAFFGLPEGKITPCQPLAPF